MENQRPNPLSGHFRQPAIYLRLPSNGQWWAENALNLPANGEIPVYPMSAKDEIILRTPDALLNGQGMVNVIQSCCPNILDAWGMPSVDVDAVLVGIRIATYGNSMNLDTKCRHCNADNTHGAELGSVLGSIRCPDYNKTLDYRGLKIKFKPQHYFAVNRNNMIDFEEQKILKILNSTDLDPNDKANQLTASMERFYQLGIDGCTNSTEYIDMQDGTRVTEKEFINEFYQNADSPLIKAIQDRMTEFTETAKPARLQLMCNSCTQVYPVEFTFDYASFFANGF